MEKMQYNFLEQKPAEVVMEFELNGKKLVVYNRIPYADKRAFAEEQVSKTQVQDEQLGICYSSPAYHMIRKYLFIKYYTNIDVSTVADDETGYETVYDFADSYGLFDQEIMKACEADQDMVDSIAAGTDWALVKTFEAAHSLGNMVKPLLNTSVDTNNSETKELIEKLIDMKGALLEKEESETKTAKPVTVGGAVINFAKR